MVTKDWILLLVPIFLEGIIIFFVQAHFNRRFARLEKKLAIKDDVVLTFLKMIMDISFEYQNTFRSGRLTTPDKIQSFLDMVHNTGLYYNANQQDLENISSEFILFYGSWTAFVEFWNTHDGQEYSSVANEINTKLDACKENTDALIQAIRDKVFGK